MKKLALILVIMTTVFGFTSRSKEKECICTTTTQVLTLPGKPQESVTVTAKLESRYNTKEHCLSGNGTITRTERLGYSTEVEVKDITTCIVR